MIIAVLTVDLFLYDSASLKDKRGVIRRIKDRVSNNFNVSVAEVGHLDKWQRAQLGIAQVGNDFKFLEKSIHKILEMMDEYEAVEVTEHLIEYL